MRMGRCLLRTRQRLLYIWSVPKKLPRGVCRPGNRFGSDEQIFEGERRLSLETGLATSTLSE